MAGLRQDLRGKGEGIGIACRVLVDNFARFAREIFDLWWVLNCFGVNSVRRRGAGAILGGWNAFGRILTLCKLFILNGLWSKYLLFDKARMKGG